MITLWMATNNFTNEARFFIDEVFAIEWLTQGESYTQYDRFIKIRNQVVGKVTEICLNTPKTKEN